MSLIVQQADALEALLKDGADVAAPHELLSAALACCHGLLNMGETDRALRLIRNSSVLAPGQDAELRARFSIGRLRALYLSYDNSECLAEARSASIACAESGHLKEARVARIYEGMSLWRLNRVEESLRLLQPLRDELLREPESTALAMCAAAISSAFVSSGKWSEAKQFGLDAMVSAFRQGDKYWEAIAWLNISVAERGLARYAAAEEAARSALACLEGLDHPFQKNHTHRVLSVVLWKRGKLEHALGLADDCFESAKARENIGQLKYARLLKAVIHTHAGRFDDARAMLEAPIWVGGPTPESRPSLLRHEYLGDLHLERGEVAEAQRYYDELWPRAMALVPRGDIVAELRRRIAECHLLRGDAMRARAEALDAIEHCAEIGDRYEEAATYRVLALAHAALGQLEEARKAFDRGFALYDEIETPYEWGKLWMSFGDWVAREDAKAYWNRSHALEAYRAAIEHFERIGAQYRLTEARARLEGLETRMKADGERYVSTDRRARPVRRPRVNAELNRRSQDAFESFGVVTRNRTVLEMLDDISKVAVSDLPVLVLGESGTGKELIAQGVHRLSGRTGEFVALNCSAVPAAMLEAEIFGHVKGSFTHAVVDKPGLFEVADGGTIFLDEIGEMSPELQAKLLRFLETGTLRRVGATHDVSVDTRVVAATNRSREAMQKGDGFRSDLYYRLAHAVYVLPPLRQRGDDVELLVEHFLAVTNRELGKRVVLSDAARERLAAHPWPGNVRQLRAVLRKMVVSAGSDELLLPRHVPSDDLGRGPDTLDAELEAQEKSQIERALREANGVTAAAAKLLRLKRTTLVGRMKRLGIRG